MKKPTEVGEQLGEGDLFDVLEAEVLHGWREVAGEAVVSTSVESRERLLAFVATQD
ncbi:MAG: hypothetical protein IT406_01570 [Candidatus Yanofskybacteria bacterium]|nr:hypothetical protein [Candidatus Yanofskybacteria bacterium]